MKKLIQQALAIVCITASINASAQSIIENIGGYSTITPGKAFIQNNTNLTYQVEAGEENYEMTIDVNKYSAEGIQFDWAISHKKTKGKVTIAKEALSNATSLDNYFGAKDKSLTDKTTVFLSAATWKAVKAGENVKLSCGGSVGNVEFKCGQAGKGAYESQLAIWPILIRGDYVDLSKFYILEGVENSDYIIYLFDCGTDNPVIILMRLGFSISLSHASGDHL
ncbi:MAG: hypothetical protein RL660_2050 [Bacteroidota bacterium]|jgi:hypothetical protein